MGTMSKVTLCVLVICSLARVSESQAECVKYNVRTNIRYHLATSTVSTELYNLANTPTPSYVNFTVPLPLDAQISSLSVQCDGVLYETTVVLETNEPGPPQLDFDIHDQVDLGVQVLSIACLSKPQSFAELNVTYIQLLQRRLGAYEHVIHLDPSHVTTGEVLTDINVEEIGPLQAVKYNYGNGIDRRIRRPTLRTAWTQRAVSVVRAEGAWSDVVTPAKLVFRYDVKSTSLGGDILVSGGHFVHYFNPEVKHELPTDILVVAETRFAPHDPPFLDIIQRGLKQVLRQMDKDIQGMDRDFPEGACTVACEKHSSLGLAQTPSEVCDLCCETNNTETILNYDPSECDLKCKVGWKDDVGERKLETTNDCQVCCPLKHPNRFDIQQLGDKDNHRHSFEYMDPITTYNIDEAIRFVNSLEGAGYANIYQGFKEAFKHIRLNGRRNLGRSIILALTDCLQAGRRELEVPYAIARRNHLKTPMYVMGVSQDTQWHLAQRYSLIFGGKAQRLAYNRNDTTRQIRDFYREHAHILLSHVHFNYSQAEVDDFSLTSTFFRNFFKGSDVILAGKLIDNSIQTVEAFMESKGVKMVKRRMTTSWVTAEAQPLTFELPVESRDVTEKIWALQRLHFCWDGMAELGTPFPGREDPTDVEIEYLEEAEDISVKYGLLTPLTTLEFKVAQ
ncbi:inter-alpha-trypsin inhibitor heavy chain H2 [Aplysia californica]|uniref:Inter-alpha-trypsin inhibitor heavy chain H2 n=1 Tax=Aplysia californica TaxID=6500 RepID=A0ABM1A6N5_APLCA|nr:inter-alpha-trypsin inhibitor heavy chain H2 [Aplysia californica]